MSQIFNPKKFAVLTFDWTDIFSGTAIGTLLVESVRIWRRYMDKRNFPSESLQKFNDMYSRGMKPVLDNTDAERFLILKAENGGGCLYPGAEIYTSVIYEDYRRPLGSVIDYYQRYQVDKVMLELLMKICSEGMTGIVVAGLPDSKFKNLLIKFGVAYMELHFLSQTKSKLFFATISTTNGASRFATPSERATIDLSINNLRNIFKKTAKHVK